VALARAHKADSDRIESLPGVVERLVAQEVKRYVEERVELLVEEGSSLSEDVEGVYKQLDRVAELVGKRNADIDSSLERIEALELSVGRMRRNLERAERTPAGAHGLADPPTRLARPATPGRPALDRSQDRLAALDAALERARRRRDPSRRPD
jgi:beta-glucosidase-like glycosyl hydrolase